MKTNTTTRARLAALAVTATAIAGAAYAGHDGLDELSDGSNGGKISAKAHGSYGIAGTTASISLAAKQKRHKPATGSFRHTLVFQGLLIDFVGEVTCMAVDPDNGRAWIGGIVSENLSDHPAFQTDIHQPGRDVWFRVLDTGQPPAEPDRSTFLGFEGAGGIITSAEYCAARIWPGPPDDVPNARTNALTEGKIKVKPNELNDDDSDSDD